MKNTMTNVRAKRRGLLVIIAVIAAAIFMATGCPDGDDKSGSGGGSNGDIKVFAPSTYAIVSLTIKNSAGKTVKTDSTRISPKEWRSYSVPAGTYTVKVNLSGSWESRTGYATVTAGGVTNVKF